MNFGASLLAHTHADGFAALAALDSNSDTVIDASDTAFGELKVWQDNNQDGVSQASELKTLSEHNITSISLATSDPGLTVAGHAVKLGSTFTRADSTTGTISDVWFNVKSSHTIRETEVTASDPDPALPAEVIPLACVPFLTQPGQGNGAVGRHNFMNG